MAPIRVDRSTAELLAARECGWTSSEGDLVEMSAGFSSHNWRVPLRAGDLLLKIGPVSSAQKWTAAQIGADRARNAGLAVPLLRSARVVDGHIVRALRWVGGESALTLADDHRAQAKLGADLGGALALLHTAEVEGFTSRLDGSSQVFPNWTDYVRDRLEAVELRAASADAPESALRRRAAAIVGELAASVSGDCRPVVCHRDLHADNLIVASDGSLRGIVDWDMAEAWDAAGEWFKLELFLFERLPHARAAFDSAYEAVAPVVGADRRKLVILMECLNVVANVNSFSADFTAWGIDQLKRWTLNT